MSEGRKQRSDWRCDFCGEQESDGRSMVAGPGVYICNQCIELSVAILEQRGVRVSHWRPDDADSN